MCIRDRSRGLTRSIRQLCEKIDSRDTSNYSDITVEGRISNQELQKVVHSFNRLNSRLTQSLQQNYQSRLNEQQMHIQVLQAQINHHFLYNTLKDVYKRQVQGHFSIPPAPDFLR